MRETAPFSLNFVGEVATKIGSLVDLGIFPYADLADVGLDEVSLITFKKLIVRSRQYSPTLTG